MKTQKSVFVGTEIDNTIDSEKTIVFSFFNSRKNSLLKDLKKQFPKSTVIGCSSAGNILGNEILDDTIIFSAIKLEHPSSMFKKINLNAKNIDTFELGQSVSKELCDDELKGILILSDGLINGSRLMEGINSSMKKDIPVGGGMAGDGTEFEYTYILDEGEIREGRVIAIGFYGKELSFNTFFEGGWSNFGQTRQVTKSEGNIVYELDHKPILSLYKDLLGKELSDKLPSSAFYYPLSITDENGLGEKIVRTILSYDEEKQSLTFAGDIEKGSFVRLMHTTNDQLIGSARLKKFQIN